MYAETACVTYYETPMSWENAQSKCRSDKSELISFPNREKILLIYNGTYNKDNKDAIYRAIGWTSARATDLSGCKWWFYYQVSYSLFEVLL